MSQKCLIFLYKVHPHVKWPEKNIIEIHQGAAELFAFECITRWRCSRWAKKTYCSKIHSSTARNEMKTGIVPFSRVRNSKMQSNLTKKIVNG